MFKVIKTNRRQVEYNFNSIEELQLYADKNKYVRGSIELYRDGQLVLTYTDNYGHHLGALDDGHALWSYCLYKNYNLTTE